MISNRRTRYYELGDPISSWGNAQLGAFNSDFSKRLKKITSLSPVPDKTLGLNIDTDLDENKTTDVLNTLGDKFSSINGLSSVLSTAGDITTTLAKGATGKAVGAGLGKAGGVVGVASLIDSILGGTKEAIINNNQIDTDLQKYANKGDVVYSDPGAAGLMGADLSSWSKNLSDVFSDKAEWHDILGLIPFIGGAIDEGYEAKENREEALRNKKIEEETRRNARITAKKPSDEMTLTDLNSNHDYKSFFKDGGEIGSKPTPITSSDLSLDKAEELLNSGTKPTSKPLVITNHDKSYDYIKDGGKWFYAKKSSNDFKPINAAGAANMEAFINGKPDIYKTSNVKSGIKGEPTMIKGVSVNAKYNSKITSIKPDSITSVTDEYKPSKIRNYTLPIKAERIKVNNIPQVEIDKILNSTNNIKLNNVIDVPYEDNILSQKEYSNNQIEPNLESTTSTSKSTSNNGIVGVSNLKSGKIRIHYKDGTYTDKSQNEYVSSINNNVLYSNGGPIDNGLSEAEQIIKRVPTLKPSIIPTEEPKVYVDPNPQVRLTDTGDFTYTRTPHDVDYKQVESELPDDVRAAYNEKKGHSGKLYITGRNGVIYLFNNGKFIDSTPALIGANGTQEYSDNMDVNNMKSIEGWNPLSNPLIYPTSNSNKNNRVGLASIYKTSKDNTANYALHNTYNDSNRDAMYGITKLGYDRTKHKCRSTHGCVNIPGEFIENYPFPYKEDGEEKDSIYISPNRFALGGPVDGGLTEEERRNIDKQSNYYNVGIKEQSILNADNVDNRSDEFNTIEEVDDEISFYRPLANSRKRRINRRLEPLRDIENTGAASSEYALGGNLSNVPDENAVPIDENAELMVNDQGGTSGSHEQGDNIPIYEQGQGEQYVEPGEVIVEMPDGSQVALSKRLGMAQKYMELANAKEQLNQQLKYTNDTVTLGTLKRKIDAIDMDMLSLPEEQENMKAMYGLQNKPGEGAYGIESITSGLNNINLDRDPEKRRKELAERRIQRRMSIEDMEAEDKANAIKELESAYASEIGIDNKPLYDRKDINGNNVIPYDEYMDFVNTYGEAAAKEQGYTPGYQNTTTSFDASKQIQTSVDVSGMTPEEIAAKVASGELIKKGNEYHGTTGAYATDKSGNKVNVKGYNGKPVNGEDVVYVSETKPGSSSNVQSGNTPVIDKSGEPFGDNFDGGNLFELARFIDNLGNAADLKKYPDAWSPIMHTPQLVNENVDVSQPINAINANANVIRGGIRRNATSLQDIIPGVSQVSANANNQIAQVNTNANIQKQRYRDMNQRITDNAMLHNEALQMDYANRKNLVKEDILNAKSANRADFANDINAIITDRNMDKYQKQQLLADALKYQDSNSVAVAVKNGLIDVPSETYFKSLLEGLRDADGKLVRTGNGYAYDIYKQIAKDNGYAFE